MEPSYGQDDPALDEHGDVHFVVPGHPPLGVTARAVITRIVDGDTVDVEVRWPARIRLKDCWAPDLRKASEKQAAIAATDALSLMAPPGASVVVHIGTSHADSLLDLLTFSRVVGHVWRTGDADSLSELMVRGGHATKEKAR